MAANGIYECHKCHLPYVVGYYSVTTVQVHENGGKRSEKYM